MSEDKEISKTTSSGSQTSNQSLGMGPSLSMNQRDSGGVQTSSSSKLTPEGGAPPGETVYDIIAFLIYCSAHNKFALSKSDKGVWMPYVVIPPSKTYAVSADEGICIVLSKGHKELDAILQKKPPIKENKMAQLTRIQLPDQKFITQIIQIVKLGESTDDFQCCQNTKRLQWFPQMDVINGNIERIWGPEVTQIAKTNEESVVISLEEFSLEKVFEYIENESNDNSEHKILTSLQLDRKDLEKLYIDFIEHCFPSFFMSIDSFKDYMSDYGYKRNDSRLILMFNAFNIESNQFLDFHQFLVGLAAMEPNAIHEDFRFGFIFRFYDSDRDQNLTEDEIKKMLKDLFDKEDEAVLKDKVKQLIADISTKENKISYEDFSKAITSGGLKGTESLCRFSKPFMAEVSKSLAQKSRKKKSSQNEDQNSPAFLRANRKNRGICFGCRPKRFEYGLHSVKLDTSGRCVEPRRIFEPEELKAEVMTDQRFSMEYKFNSRSIAQVFLDLIRDYSKKEVKERGFLSDEKDLLIKYLTNLCSDAKSLFSHEERVMKLNSPVLIVGDIRANLEDLFSMESCLWNSFPILSANHLFLGNYVEFGDNGIECIIYLLSLKMIAPNKVYLLRGCHEFKDFQKQHNFQKECLNKYGEQIGLKVWQLINGVFDQLPIAVIIDESIFCANGGIPQSGSKVEALNAMNLDSKKYLEIANQILNNSPLTSDMKVEALNKGFSPNNDNKSAFWFNEEAVNRFFEINGFTHIIRSNNAYNSDGYAIHFGDKCLTVFSNTNFKDNNDLTTAFVDSDKIRIVTIHSKNRNKTEKTEDSEDTEKSDSDKDLD